MSETVSSSRRHPGTPRTLAVAVSAAVTGVHHAQAQQVLEEVVVTATKREVSLQDVPQAITAFTTSDIERRNFTGLDDYAKFVPSLSFGRREPLGTSVVFRGVAASGIQYGSRPSSAIYLDEQPISAAGINPDPRLIDIERVEALSGPQGTLFGDASQSGTLRIITNKPDPDAFDSWIDITGTKVEHGDAGYDVSAMANIPLVRDTLALRLVGFRSEEAGYIDNVLGPSLGGTFANAGRVEDDVNERTVNGGRISLRWLPNSDWTVDATATFQDQELEGFGDTNLDVGELDQVRFEPETLDEDWYQIGLTIEGKTKFADITLAGAYFNRDFRYDADATDYQFFFNAYSDYLDAFYPYYDLTFYDFGGDPRGFAFNDQSRESWTIEGRIATPSDSTSRWEGLVGVFYNKTEVKADFKSFVRGLAATPAFGYLNYLAYYYTGNFLGPTDNWFFGFYDSELDQVAVFGELSFDFTENLTITAGGRWFRVEEDFFLQQGALEQMPVSQRQPPGNAVIVTDETASSEEEGFVPKVNITYTIDEDKLLYMTYSEGFRSGGANPVRPNSIIPRSFESDKLKNYEFGAKTTWMDGRLRVNATAYTMVWDNIQIQVNDPQPAVFSLGFVNFPEAEIKGAQIDVAWRPAEGWDLHGFVNHIDAEISQAATLFAGTANPVQATEGAKLPLTPDWKAAFGVQYSFQQRFLGAQPYARFDYSYQGESINALAGLEGVVFAPGPTIQDPYHIGDLKIGLEGDKWNASFFIDNLWDERADQFFSNRWGERRLSVNQPRTFGITLRRRFP